MFYENQPYSEIYGIHPHKIAATKHGWRHLQNDKNVWTGKSDKQMDELAVRMHANRDWLGANNHRMRLIEGHRSQTFEGLSVSDLRAAPQQPIGAVRAEDTALEPLKPLASRDLLVHAMAELLFLRMAALLVQIELHRLQLRSRRVHRTIQQHHLRIQQVAGP